VKLFTGPGRLFVNGAALWAPRLPGWEQARAILSGREPPPPAAAPRPAPQLLPPNERRRAPDTVAVALESALAACQAAQLAPASLSCVFGSTHGDLAITDYMCTTLAATPAQVSPTRFHNSVHNAAAGYWSIGAACTRPYTAISAGPHTFGAGLLETCAQVLSSGENILFVLYDIDARGPLAAVAPSRGLLSAALVIGTEPGKQLLAPSTSNCWRRRTSSRASRNRECSAGGRQRQRSLPAVHGSTGARRRTPGPLPRRSGTGARNLAAGTRLTSRDPAPWRRRGRWRWRRPHGSPVNSYCQLDGLIISTRASISISPGSASM
jgi:hypothetical protein